MKNAKKLFLFFFLYLIVIKFVDAQNDSIPPISIKSSFFGNIFTGFYYSPGDKYKPASGFELSTGLMGYKASWGDKASATLIYDVFRTTNNIEVRDTNKNLLDVSYTRGSDYTGFLKMAQIDFNLGKGFEFSIGQLLNQQYLTYQDRFWGFRYVATTFQEMYRFGAPADFGARLTYNHNNKLKLTLGSVNGDGPFRLQDKEGYMQYFTNIEWSPIKEYILKVFVDHSPVKNMPSRNAISLFTGYKTDNWRLGIEYNRVENHLNNSIFDLSGTSVYGAYKLKEGWHLLFRHDYIEKSMTTEKDNYIIAGCEHEPYKGLYVSLNGRFLSKTEISWIYFNFGARF